MCLRFVEGFKMLLFVLILVRLSIWIINGWGVGKKLGVFLFINCCFSCLINLVCFFFGFKVDIWVYWWYFWRVVLRVGRLVRFIFWIWLYCFRLFLSYFWLILFLMMGIIVLIFLIEFFLKWISYWFFFIDIVVWYKCWVFIFCFLIVFNLLIIFWRCF